MRSRLFCLALLPLFLLVLALPAHADPMDDFAITSTGLTIDFSLPASTTQTCCGYGNQFNFGTVTGTVNNVSEPIELNFITGSGCAVCETILVSYPSESWTIDLPSLYGITYSGMDETLTFIPGDYMTQGYNGQLDYESFGIDVTPAATPEPATIFSLLTAVLALPLLMRRRLVI